MSEPTPTTAIDPINRPPALKWGIGPDSVIGRARREQDEREAAAERRETAKFVLSNPNTGKDIRRIAEQVLMRHLQHESREGPFEPGSIAVVGGTESDHVTAKQDP